MTTAPSSLVLGTSAQPVHLGCATPGSPRASWHREDHRVLVETRCPDCGATWTTEVPREPPVAEQAEQAPPQWHSFGQRQLDNLDGLPTSAGRFAKTATAAGWDVRAYYAWGVEDGQHDYESVGLAASHDDPRVVVVRCWLRRTSTASASWAFDGAWLRWPHGQPLTDDEAKAVIATPTLGLAVVAAAIQPTKRGHTDAVKAADARAEGAAPRAARTASARQREAASGG